MDKLGRESETVEFKESLTEKEKEYDALAAMLNKHGHGTLYFGIRDDGTVKGIDIGKNTLRTISQDIYNGIQPQVIPEIEVHETERRQYVSVKVSGAQRPYARNGRYLTRSGEENRIIPPSELRRLFQSCADLLKDTEASNQDLSFTELSSALGTRGYHLGNTEKMLKSLGPHLSNRRYCREAELLSDNNPFALTVTVFNGSDRLSLSRRTDFSGHSLLEEARSVLSYVCTFNDVRTDMTDLVRKDIPLFDERRFREAWMNAAVHNTWVLGVPPTVHIFDDRMEIESFGSIPYGSTEEDFFDGISMPVNESLMRIFIMVGLCEHTGHGIPVITERYGREAFRITNRAVVTIPFERPRSTEKETKSDLSVNERLILSLLASSPEMTLDKVAEVTSLGQSNVRAIVSRLKAKGLLERQGSRKKGKWVVKQRSVRCPRTWQIAFSHGPDSPEKRVLHYSARRTDCTSTKLRNIDSTVMTVHLI